MLPLFYLYSKIIKREKFSLSYSYSYYNHFQILRSSNQFTFIIKQCTNTHASSFFQLLGVWRFVKPCKYKQLCICMNNFELLYESFHVRICLQMCTQICICTQSICPKLHFYAPMFDMHVHIFTVLIMRRHTFTWHTFYAYSIAIYASCGCAYFIILLLQKGLLLDFTCICFVETAMFYAACVPKIANMQPILCCILSHS